MRPILALLASMAAACTVSTSRLDDLEPCDVDAHCRPGYVCVEGVCAISPPEDGSTADAPLAQCTTTAMCDDGNACNGRELCLYGNCVAGEPLDCSYLDDSRLCLVGVCERGLCSQQPAPDDTPCRDDIFCEGGDLCEGGRCVGGTVPACDDGDSCTEDICDEDKDECRSVLLTEGPVDDETCLDEVDNDCDGLTDDADDGCQSPCPTGTACDDGVFCNGPDQCQSHECVNIGPSPCVEDGLSCTETCDEASETCNALMPGMCLIGGLCYSTGELNPLNPCQECAAQVNTMDWTNDNTNACTDGAFCNGIDVCSDGSCVSTGTLPCEDDGLPCTTTCDETIDACNVANPGFCIIGNVCYSNGQSDPTNACRACLSSVNSTQWTPDDSNSCSDAYTCTVDFCSGGVCNSSPGACAPGEVCAPECFGGPSGCGVPPGSLSLSCSSPIPAPGTSDCALTLASGTTTGQAACMSCQADGGFAILGYADFQECPDLDGFNATVGTPGCGTSDPNIFLEASNQDWTIERSFDTTGMDELVLCFSYAGNAMGSGDTLLVELCTDAPCAAPLTLFSDAAGPSLGDTSFYRYCFDLDALDPLTADNPNLVVRFSASSGGTGQLVQLDDVELRGAMRPCVPQEVVVDQDVFVCLGTNCEVTDWMAGAGCDINDPCNAGGLQAGSNENLEICSSFSLAASDRVVYLAVDVGENDGDDGAQLETMAIEYCEGPPTAGCVCAAGWQTAFAHVGDMDGVAVLGAMRPVWVNLTALGFSGSEVGVRLVAAANGPTDFVRFTRVEVGTIDYACSADLSVGTITEVGGGDYSVTMDSASAQTAKMYCAWPGSPPVEDQVLIDFMP